MSYSFTSRSDSPAESMRFSSEATDKGWTLVGEGKKRKIRDERLIGSVNRAKAFLFLSQGIKALIKKQL
jgi:hypothetical protein